MNFSNSRTDPYSYKKLFKNQNHWLFRSLKKKNVSLVAGKKMFGPCGFSPLGSDTFSEGLVVWGTLVQFLTWSRDVWPVSRAGPWNHDLDQSCPTGPFWVPLDHDVSGSSSASVGILVDLTWIWCYVQRISQQNLQKGLSEPLLSELLRFHCESGFQHPDQLFYISVHKELSSWNWS